MMPATVIRVHFQQGREFPVPYGRDGLFVCVSCYSCGAKTSDASCKR
jgi:hypothetical protein